MAHQDHAARKVVAKFVYHVYEPQDDSEFITILMDDKVFQIRPHEPYEMSADSNGRLLDAPGFYMYQMLQTYSGLYGLVEVEAVSTRTGIQLDIDKAERDATRLLEQNRWRHIETWVQAQLNERVAQAKAILPPQGFIEESIKVLNVDLAARYNIKPIGWDWKPDTSRPIVNTRDLGLVTAAAPVNEEIESLKQELADRDARLDRMEALLERLLSGGGKAIVEEGTGADVYHSHPAGGEEVSVGSVTPKSRKR
jgi:hypothetical protein